MEKFNELMNNWNVKKTFEYIASTKTLKEYNTNPMIQTGVNVNIINIGD
jgi:hypothetical protein